ncbi:MAG TPA: hypothetical protein VGQ13_04050 [Nitrososphaera sp.]|jgi:hypothetical protein|nr:hypothetical protein [Nitrososphaera sp.]
MSESNDELGLPIKAEGSATYRKENILHVARLETDTIEICKPKVIRKRHRFFGEKVVVFHYRGGDDYYINDIR